MEPHCNEIKNLITKKQYTIYGLLVDVRIRLPALRPPLPTKISGV